jgi:pimeloyl-ACP methyl ester carboxylesterase
VNLIVDSLHISGLDSGSGKTALLLHGWGNDHRSLTQIADSLKGYRVIAPDLPGFGGSQSPKEVWGVNEYAEFVVKLLDKLEVKEVELLIGHSFGGRISVYMAGTGMIPIDRLVLMASHGLPEPKTIKGMMIWSLARLGKLMPKFIRQPVGRRFTSSDFRAAQGIMQDVFKKVIAQDATTQARAIKCPTLLIYGSEDRITPPLMGQKFNELIEHSKLELVEGENHHLHQHSPDKITKLIEEFIK